VSQAFAAPVGQEQGAASGPLLQLTEEREEQLSAPGKNNRVLLVHNTSGIPGIRFQRIESDRDPLKWHYRVVVGYQDGRTTKKTSFSAKQHGGIDGALMAALGRRAEHQNTVPTMQQALDALNRFLQGEAVAYLEAKGVPMPPVNNPTITKLAEADPGDDDDPDNGLSPDENSAPNHRGG